jgi:hypothetical protein
MLAVRTSYGVPSLLVRSSQYFDPCLTTPTHSDKLLIWVCSQLGWLLIELSFQLLPKVARVFPHPGEPRPLPTSPIHHCCANTHLAVGHDT